MALSGVKCDCVDLRVPLPHTPPRKVVDVHPVDLGPRASDFELELCNNMMEL